MRSSPELILSFLIMIAGTTFGFGGGRSSFGGGGGGASHDTTGHTTFNTTRNAFRAARVFLIRRIGIGLGLDELRHFGRLHHRLRCLRRRHRFFGAAFGGGGGGGSGAVAMNCTVSGGGCTSSTWMKE